jgi:RNA polymerase sigma-70 factor (ECF subfamily)
MLLPEKRAVTATELDFTQVLAERAAGGDRKAAEELLRALLPRVRNLVRYLVRSDADVDDLAQEAMVALLRGLTGYRGEGSLRAWADRVVVRSVFAQLRRKRASERGHVEYTPELVAVPNEQASPQFLARRRALAALDEVPAEQRQVLVLHHVVGLAVRDIADELAIPFETVRSRLRLGMARLRRELGEHEALPTRPQ